MRPNSDLDAICISCDLVRDLACIIMVHRCGCGAGLSQREIVMRSHEIHGGTETSVRPHRRGHMLYRGLDAPSNVTNRPGGGLERSDTCDPSTSIFIHLRVALSGRCHNQLRPDSLETAGYGKRCSIGCVGACSTLIPALSSLKPSTYTHQLRVGDAASRAEAVMSDGTR